MTMGNGPEIPRDFAREARALASEQNNVVLAGLKKGLLTQTNIDLKTLLSLFKKILLREDFERLVQESFNVRSHKRIAIKDLDDLKRCMNKLQLNLESSTNLNDKILKLSNGVFANINSNISKFEHVKNGSEIFLKVGNYDSLAAEIEKKKPGRLTKFKHLIVPGAKKKYLQKQKVVAEQAKISNFELWKDEMLKASVAAASQLFVVNSSDQQIVQLKKLIRKHTNEQLRTEPPAVKTHRKIVGEIATTVKQLTTTVASNVIAEYFAKETQFDRRASDNLSLNQHAKNALDYAIKRASFDIMLDFLANAYQIYQYSNEYDEQNGIDLAQQGFKRLQDPAFKEFMLKMLDNLGFDIQDPQVMLNLSTLSPEELNQRREAFARNNTPEATAKFVKAKDIFFKECAAAKALSSPNEYYGLMSFSEQALLNVESKQRLANMTKLLPDLDNIANYNPDLSYSAGAHAKFTAREIIKNRLVEIVGYIMESVDKQRADAQLVAQSDIDIIRGAYFDRTARRPSPSKSSRKVNREWEKAVSKASFNDPSDIQKIMIKPEESVDIIMLEQFQKAWRKEAIKLLSLVSQGGYDLFYNIVAGLEKELSDLKYQHAAPEVIALAETRINDFITFFDPRNHDVMHDIKHCSLEQLKALCAGVRGGLNQLTTQDVFAAQPIDDQQLVVAMKQAFTALGSSITIPETVFAAYDEVMRNDRARLNYEDPSFMTKWVAEKGGQILAEYLRENFEGPGITLKYLLEQKSKLMYQLSLAGNAHPSAVLELTPVTASFSTAPLPPVPVKPKQTWFQWGASRAGLELDDIKLQQKQAIAVANKLHSLLYGNDFPIKTYIEAQKVLETADAIVTQLQTNAVTAYNDYRVAEQSFNDTLSAKQEEMRHRLQAVSEKIENIVDALKQTEPPQEIASLLHNLIQARVQLEFELNSTQQAFKPHERAYQQQGMLDFSKSPEYAALSTQIRRFEELTDKTIKLSSEMVNAHTQMEERERQITEIMYELSNNPTGLNATIVKLYQDITDGNAGKNVKMITKEMEALLDTLSNEVNTAKENVLKNPKGYFYWTTSQAALDAEKALQLAEERQVKMQVLRERFVNAKGREPSVNIDIAKELQALAPQLVLDEQAARKKCQHDYRDKCATLAIQFDSMVNEIRIVEPYFARPSLEEAHAKAEEQKHKNAIKYQGELNDHVETVARMHNLISTAQEIAKDRQTGQVQIEKEQGFTYHFVYYMLDKYFSGAGLTKTAFKAIVATYAGTLINQSADRANDLDVVLVHHLGRERADDLQKYLGIVQSTYNFLQTPPLQANATWGDVAIHGAYAGAAAGVVAAVPAAFWAIPSGPLGMITAGTIAGTTAGLKAAALAIGASLVSPIIVEVTQEAADYALKRAIGPKAVANFYSHYHIAKEVVSQGIHKADKVTMATVNDWYNNAPDKEIINKVLIAEGTKAFRGQTFDAFIMMLRHLHELTEVINGADNSQYRFAELGFDRLRSRDFALIKQYMLESLGLESSDLNRPLDPEHINRLREAFIAGSRVEGDLRPDPFIVLMGTVTKEYKDVINLIQQGKLKHSCNYVSLVTAMHNIVSNVDMVQKATKATELYLPNMNQKLKTQAADGNKTFVQYLKENAALEIAPQVAQTGVAYVVQDSVTQSTKMASNLVTAAKAKLTELETLTPLGAEAPNEPAYPCAARRASALTFVTRRRTSSAASSSMSSNEPSQTERPDSERPRRPRH